MSPRNMSTLNFTVTSAICQATVTDAEVTLADRTRGPKAVNHFFPSQIPIAVLFEARVFLVVTVLPLLGILDPFGQFCGSHVSLSGAEDRRETETESVDRGPFLGEKASRWTACYCSTLERSKIAFLILFVMWSGIPKSRCWLLRWAISLADVGFVYTYGYSRDPASTWPTGDPHI